MKKRRNKFFDIRVQFFFICMAGFIGVALLAALAAWGLEHLGVNVPMFVWLLIFTLLLGSATAAGFSIAFFAPISRLSRAMKGRGRQLPRACGDEERLSRYPRQL